MLCIFRNIQCYVHLETRVYLDLHSFRINRICDKNNIFCGLTVRASKLLMQCKMDMKVPGRLIWKWMHVSFSFSFDYSEDHELVSLHYQLVFLWKMLFLRHFGSGGLIKWLATTTNFSVSFVFKPSLEKVTCSISVIESLDID